MKSFAAYLHAKGMQLSVYTDAGVKNCCQEPGESSALHTLVGLPERARG